MDFNTGGRGPDDRPLYGGEAGGSAGGPARGSVGGGARGEFNLQDPVGSFVATARNVFLNPVGFFRGIARSGDFVNPLVFAVICALISALLGGILTLVLSPLFAGPGETGEAVTGGIVGFLVSLILTPIYVVILLAILSGLYHLLVLLLVKPRSTGFEATFRVVSYVQAIQLVSWIPIVNIIAGIYGIILSIFGIREVHSTTTGKAAAVVLIPIAVLLLLVLLIAVLIGAAIFVGSQQ